MAKVEVYNMTVHNVEPCPECGSEEYCRYEEKITPSIQTMRVGCNMCDFKPKSAIQLFATISAKNDFEEFKETTRSMFNLWNKNVAEIKNTETKRVRMIKHKTEKRKE